MAPRPTKSLILLLAVVVSLLAACGGKKVPNLDLIFARTKLQTGKRPVIIIPGILGNELVNPKTGEKVWFRLDSSEDDDLRLPVSPDLAANRDNLEPRRIIERARVSRFLPEIAVYQNLISAIERYGGYTEGDWENPDVKNGAQDHYYVFAYDWRRDNVENARLLVRKIDELKQKLGRSDLRFNVIAHSMGGLIARYAAMYGDADLPAAGRRPAPDWSGARHFNKVFMFGTPNEGSMEALEVLLKGYSFGNFKVDILGPEVVFTSPAIFQLLPHQATVNFFDEDLESLDVDLYSPETWKKYGWSVYHPSFSAAVNGNANNRKNAQRNHLAALSPAELDAYFMSVLGRAKAFHEALNSDTAVPSSISFFAFGSDCDNTLDGAIIRRHPKTNAWQTIFEPRGYRTTAGRRITKEAIRAKIYAPGDERVTRRSLLAETIAQINYRNSLFRRSLPVTAIFFCESHDELPNSKIMQDNFLTALVQELLQ